MLKRADPKNQPRTALDSYSRHMSWLTPGLTLNARKVNEKLSVSKTNFFHLCAGVFSVLIRYTEPGLPTLFT